MMWKLSATDPNGHKYCVKKRGTPFTNVILLINTQWFLLIPTDIPLHFKWHLIDSQQADSPLSHTCEQRRAKQRRQKGV